MLGDMKVTIDLDGDIYRAVKVEAARSDRSVRDIVDEALAAWLEAAEDREDRESAEDALDRVPARRRRSGRSLPRDAGRGDEGDLRPRRR